MQARDILRRKRDGAELTAAELTAFAQAAADSSWPDYQLSALLMAIVLRGMTAAETAHLTRAMAESGDRANLDDLPGIKIDKHSTGGVGDKTSLILGPLAAACGVVVPMMSGRGLGHSGGTLDKLEAIPGFRVNLSLDEFRQALRTVGIGMIGQTATIAPADRTLYALRDVTATVESIPLITASILSKKLAEGISGLVLDVKCGGGAFMRTEAAARELAESLVAGGRANGLQVEAILTAMDAPLGRAVGNALEVAECIAILNPAVARPPDALTEMSVHLAARMVRLAGRATSLPDAERQVQTALANGDGLATFRRMVAQQGGDPRVTETPETILPRAPLQTSLNAPTDGFVTRLDAFQIGTAAVRLGAGRATAQDTIDPAVGIEVVAPIGTRVRAGEPVLIVHARDEATLADAHPLLESAIEIASTSPAPMPWFLGELS